MDLSSAFTSASEQSITAGSPTEGMLMITAPFGGTYNGTYEYVYNLTYLLPAGAKASRFLTWSDVPHLLLLSERSTVITGRRVTTVCC